ncbi:MAG: Hpt domain-containing protein [Desulfobulbaceae bacterium]|nr:Hpt domain-containing protein [Desulfobulbaceae bacterium]HIJ91035.1 response regulator [Deltaproteobacteria bacterium]
METEIFKEEAFELLDDIEGTLLLLRDDLANTEHINRIFRAVHTVKGSGAMFGFNEVADFAHKFENAIDAIRKGEAKLTEECLDVFLAARDQIKVILEAENPAAPEVTQESQELIRQLITVVKEPGASPPQSQSQATDVIPPPPPQVPPAPTAPASEPPCPEAGVITAADLLRLPRLTALIVEDEFISRYITQEFLHPLGTCHIAVNGFEAILAFKNGLVEKRPYDLVCLDIMMPGMTGTEVAKEMRRLEAELGVKKPSKIVMTTAVSDKEIIVELFQKKLCDAYLIKPISREKLYELIQKFFGSPLAQN